MRYTPEELLRKYGEHSPGTHVEYEALLNSTFIRSQVQLALADFGGSGHIYNAKEAIDNFPITTLLKVVREGSAPLIPSSAEPSSTLRQRREELNLKRSVLAQCTGLAESDIEQAETAGKVTPIRKLEKIAQYLGLDDRQIGIVPAAGGDPGLSVRLRELSGGDTRRFSPNVVVSLSEAAWVVSRQLFLSRRLGLLQHSILSEAKSHNFNYPNWERGYELAERTRRKLGLYNDEPIESLRLLIEETLGIPLIQVKLPSHLAGATISNGTQRGIIVNELGQNENVCVRRMTMCHELGHLLWDPDEKLNTLAVDDYDTVNSIGHASSYDLPEIRANAFAVAFLAPREAVLKISRDTGDLAETVRQVASHFRISATAARHHVCNILSDRYERVAEVSIPGPLREWEASENLIIDFFPTQTTPISRRGRFAQLVARALINGIISKDSAALMLQCEHEEVEQAANTIIEALPLDSTAD